MDKALLALVIDESQDESVRIAALADLVECLPANHPYRLVPVEELYDRILPDYATRPYLRNGRMVMLTVSRPPQTLPDIL